MLSWVWMYIFTKKYLLAREHLQKPRTLLAPCHHTLLVPAASRNVPPEAEAAAPAPAPAPAPAEAPVVAGAAATAAGLAPGGAVAAAGGPMAIDVTRPSPLPGKARTAAISRNSNPHTGGRAGGAKKMRVRMSTCCLPLQTSTTEAWNGGGGGG